jgi:hypothetical protein
VSGIVTAQLLVACGGVSVVEDGYTGGTGGSGTGGSSGGSGAAGGSGGVGGTGVGGTGVGGSGALGGTGAVGGTGVVGGAGGAGAVSGAGGSGAVGGTGAIGGTGGTETGTLVVALGCGGDSFAPLLAHGLNLPDPVDHLAVYSYGNLTPMDSIGAPCDGAVNRAACENEYAAALAAYPTPLLPPPLALPGRPSTIAYVAFTRGDDVSLVGENAELVSLLGEIDTPNEALLSFYVNGYTANCQALYQNYGVYYLTTSLLPSCGPGYPSYRLQVTTDGAVSATGIGVFMEGCVGRRPHGLALSAPSENAPATGRYYARIAELEAAAVIAFERLLIDLADAGAPLGLLRRLEDAQRDEVRHARVMAELAGRYGAEVAAPRVSPRRTPTLLEMALENVTEGCVRETWGALSARYQCQTAESFADRTIWSAVADDEARHAELSFDLHTWLMSRLSPEERLEVEAARLRAWEELLVELDSEPEPDVRRRAGVPSRSAALEMARELTLKLRSFSAETHAA